MCQSAIPQDADPKESILSCHPKTPHPWSFWLEAALFVLTPFIVFYWMIPFVSPLSLGNDYIEYAIHNQMEMLFGLRTGTFPLYMPGRGSISYLMMGGIWHPISYLAGSLPGYWVGNALEWNTLLRFFELILAQWGLYRLFRRLNILWWIAWIGSFQAVYNARMLDTFHYGSSLECYAAFIWLVTAIAYRFLEMHRRRWWFAIIAAAYLMLTGGHQQTAYYGLLSAGVLTLLTPFMIRVFKPDVGEISLSVLIRFYCSVLAFTMLGILAAAADLLPLSMDVVNSDAERSAPPYFFSAQFGATLYGNLASFFNPYYADFHNSFGGSPFFLLAALLPLVIFWKKSVDRVAMGLWLFFVIVFLVTLHLYTPLHYISWKILPYFKTFRCPGRIGLCIPLVLSLTWCWMVSCPPAETRLNRRIFFHAPAYAWLSMIVAFLYFLLALVPLYALRVGHWGQNNYFDMTPAYINSIPVFFRRFVPVSAVGALGVLGLSGFLTGRVRTILCSLLVVLLLSHTTAVLRYSQFVWERWEMPTFEDMLAFKQKRFQYQFSPPGISDEIKKHIAKTFVEPSLARLCPNWLPVDSQDEAYRILESDRRADRLVIEKAPTDSLPVQGVDGGRIRLVYSSYNRMTFLLDVPGPTWFSLNYPYDRHWAASRNGEKVPILRANALEQAVWIPDSGRWEVEFRYFSPAAWAGVLISFSVLFFVLTLAARCLRNSKWRKVSYLLALMFCVSCVLIWRHSLYTGRDIGYRYEWSPANRPDSANVAYGRHATASSVYRDEILQIYNPNRAVDGDSSSWSWYCSYPGDGSAWWQTDLGSVKALERMIVWESRELSDNLMRIGSRLDMKKKGVPPPDIVKQPFLTWEICLSDDEKTWRVVRTIPRDGSVEKHEINLDGARARYVRVRLQEPGLLAFSEVEVYASPEQDR